MSLRSILAILLFAATASAQTVINVDAKASRHRINPNVYGCAFATAAQLDDLNVPLNRHGGNATTRYNWQQNCSSRAFDWYWESLEEEGGATPGAYVDDFVQSTKAGNALPMVTIPISGWVAKLGPNRQRLSSFSIAKYGAQEKNDWQWFPDAGNGNKPDGTPITNNDPYDANMTVDVAFQEGWIQHLVTKWGNASAAGVPYYVLDNEHSIWFSTHRDVKPTGATMDELKTRMVQHAEMIKSVDPAAKIVAPEEWGWSAYFMSGYDQQWSSVHQQWSDTPDRVAHGGWDYLPWLLTQFRDVEITSGRRLLDVFTVHYYPQGGEYNYWDDSAWTNGLRNKSTRSLWDPNYTDQSWIGDQVQLIPRLKDWVDRYYPGTEIGLTEYSWGGEQFMSGALAQADIMGILGREGIDLATRWTTPETGEPAYNAMKLWRNYDGAKSAFGDISVSASAPNPDNIAAFAAVRTSDQKLTVVLINKQDSSASTTVNLANYTTSGNAQRWQMTLANTSIVHTSDVTVASNALSLTLPARSITMLVIPGTSDVIDPAIALTNTTQNEDGTFSFSGTASDASGIATVTYRVNGGTPSGTATGTTSWSVSSIRMPNPWNVITFTAKDNNGNIKAVSSTIVSQSISQPPPRPRKRRRPSSH
ncbi:MAG TPA: glycoside hydrolase family 44 protein [Thermoanaerobaculia bacterium]|nr:glycoside hydrolase family 44 protein [Thermoanaerobaculia bacterium]